MSSEHRCASKHHDHDHETSHEKSCSNGNSCEDCPSKKAEKASELSDDSPIKIHRRFDRFARLVGDRGVDRLSHAHVMVFGVGGVGSFAAEALARSGVGAITLVDFDLVCITNTNRQLHAMKGTVGKAKVDVMAERLRLIHPTCRVEPIRMFYEAETRDMFLKSDNMPSFVIDAIDNITAKLDLLATCLRLNIPVVSSMGAAGRIDPTQVRIADLAHTIRDGLAREVRKHLVKVHQVQPQPDGTFGIAAVYSEEHLAPPADVHADAKDGFMCVCPQGDNEHHSCDKRARIDGTASFVTGTFGLVAASHVVRMLARPEEAARVRSTPRSSGQREKRTDVRS